MSRWLLLLLVACTCALGLVACGDDQDDASVGTILDATFGNGKDVKSGRLDVSVKLAAKGGGQADQTLGAKLSGPFVSGKGDLPTFDLTAAVDLAARQLDLGAVFTGDRGFVKLDDQSYEIPADTFRKIREDYAAASRCTDQQGKRTTTLSALGVDPRKWLVGAKKAGKAEDVGGAKTTHITASIDVAKFLGDVNDIAAKADPQATADPCAKDDKPSTGKQSSTQLTDAQRSQLANAVKSAKFDVWTGVEDRAMRRVNVVLDLDVPEAARAQLGGIASARLTFDATIGALNAKQTIKAPKNPQPFEQLEAVLQGQTSSGGAGASGGTSSKYQQCLAQAGQDIKKLQQCQSLVGQ